MNIQTAALNKRISVVGTTGSGKSYVSRILSQALGLKAYELDELRDAVPGGQLNTEEFSKRVDKLTRLNEWIIDGHYVAIRHIIWKRTDTVVFINYPLHVVFGQLIGRYITKTLKSGEPANPVHRNIPSDVSAQGLGIWNKRWNRLLKTFRERQDYRRTLSLPEYDNLTVIELTSRKATREWLRSLTDEGAARRDRPKMKREDALGQMQQAS